MGGPLPRTIEDQKLLLDKDGLGDHRTDAARTPESGKSSHDMDEKDDEIAHLSILARTAKPWNYASKIAIRQGQVLPHFCCKTIAHCDEVPRILSLTVVTISRRLPRFFRQVNDG
jgi:hypothetical protein